MAAAAGWPVADSQTMTEDQTINGANLPPSVGCKFFVSNRHVSKPLFSAGSRTPPIPGDARGCVAFAEEVG